MESFTDTPSAMIARPIHQVGKVEDLEAEMKQMERVDVPLNHVFTPGLYTRMAFIPNDTFLTSKIHKTTHPVVLLKGSADVWTEQEGWVRLVAPWWGVTTPGTRRVIKTLEDTIWMTFHPTTETDLDKIEDLIIDSNGAQ